MAKKTNPTIEDLSPPSTEPESGRDSPLSKRRLDRFAALELRLRTVEDRVENLRFRETSTAEAVTDLIHKMQENFEPQNVFVDAHPVGPHAPPSDDVNPGEEEIAREDSFENTLESVDYRLSLLESEIGYDLEHDSQDFRKFLAENRHLDDFTQHWAIRIADLDTEVAALKDKLADIRNPPVFAETKARFREAARLGQILAKTAPQLPANPDTLVRRLRRRDFFITADVARGILDGLRTHWILILEGAPGTGKSRLAHLLPQVLLDGGGDHATFLAASVNPDWTTHNTIGGLRMVSSQLGPHLGVVTRAVLKCIENDGRLWLILDEINRGPLGRFLAPVFDTMANLGEGVSQLEHPHIFFDEAETAGKLPVPGTFRIIGTMNSFEKDQLNDFGEALRRRCAFVSLTQPGDRYERQLVTMAIRNEVVTNAPADAVVLAWIESHLEELVSQCLALTNRVRLLRTASGGYAWRHAEIGSATPMKIGQRAVLHLLDQSQKGDGRRIDHAVDHGFCETFFKSLDSPSIEFLEAISAGVITPAEFPKSSAKLQALLKDLQVL